MTPLATRMRARGRVGSPFAAGPARSDTQYSAIWSLDQINDVSVQSAGLNGEVNAGRIGHAPMYYIALCAQSEDCLPNVSEKLWLFDDHDESVYQHYHHEIRKNMTAGGILAKRDAELEALRKQIAGQRKSWWWRLFGSD